MEDFGELLGVLTIFFFILTIMNYLVKLVNRKYSRIIAQHPRIKPLWVILMRVLVRYHKYFGFATLIALLLHFAIQLNFRWVSISGLMAASVLFTQFMLGMYGAYISKKRKGLWFIGHRVVSILLVITILVHVAQS